MKNLIIFFVLVMVMVFSNYEVSYSKKAESDLRFNSNLVWGGHPSYSRGHLSVYDYYTGWMFETRQNVYLVLTIKALNKDLSIKNNTLKAYMCFPKPNNDEYTVSFEKGKSKNMYEENNYLMYELELELYEDINTQNKAVSNQFIFKVVANIPMKLNTMLVFPEPYKKNNEKSSIEFYNAPPKADLTY